MGIKIIDYKKIDQQRAYLVKYVIGSLKEEMYAKMMFDGSPVEKGIRFNDNENIFRRLLSCIGDQLNTFDAEKINKRFLEINSVEIYDYIYLAVKDAAESDYWYMWEKEY